MESQTAKEFFEKEAPQKFNPEKVKGINVTAQINLTGPQGSSWTVTIKDQKLEIVEGVYPSPTLTLKLTEEDFMDIIHKKLSAERAFFTGKVQFRGDLSTALKLKDAGFL